MAALLGLLILQLRVRNAYAGPGMHGNLLSSAILPSYAVVHSAPWHNSAQPASQ